MKHIKPAVLPFFLLLAGLILTELLIMNRDLRTRTACAVAGRGMLSLVQQTMEDPMLMYSLQFDFTGLETLSLLSQLFMYVRFGVALYCGFTANRHYYKHCRKKIQQLKGISTGNSSSEYYQTLSSIGGPSLISALLVIALVVGLVFSSSAIMAFFLM